MVTRNNVKETDNLAKLQLYSFILTFMFVFFDHQVLEYGLQSVLVLEDDVRFEPRFKRRLRAIMDDVEKAQLDWDLM